MKRTLGIILTTGAVLILALGIFACKGGEKAAQDKAAPDKKVVAAPTKPEPAKPEPAKPEPAKPTAVAGGGINQLVGNWTGDIETLKKQQPDIEKNPMAKMLLGMLGSMKIEFTKDTMIAEVMGQKKTAKFKVAASSKDALTIEALDGPKAGTKTDIKFIDATHISLQEQGKPGPAMVLKKI